MENKANNAFQYRLQEESWVGSAHNSRLAGIYTSRVSNFIDSNQWKTENLNKYRWHEAIEGSSTKISVYSPLGNDTSEPLTSEQAREQRLSFKQIMSTNPSFEPCEVGKVLGPAWSTHWFLVQVAIPSTFFDVDGKKSQGEQEEHLHFIFDCSCEGLVYTQDGVPVQALTGSEGNDRRVEFVLGTNIKPDVTEGNHKYTFFVEVACNGMFGVGQGIIDPPQKLRTFSLKRADPVKFNKDLWDMYHDMYVVYNVSRVLGLSSITGQQSLRAANRAVNLFDIHSPDTYPYARKVLQTFLNGPAKHDPQQTDSQIQSKANPNSTPLPKREWSLEEAADASIENDPTQTIIATGHCHIDTAWLWPYAETRRKIIRSWTSQLELAERYPDHKFVISQAQQMQWLLEDNPELFGKVKEAIRKGVFEAVGGTWVEMDANVPSGESFVRQFLLGQRFFLEHFGNISNVFWLPDTFGYSAQTPQFLKEARMKYFMTQKISWNNINTFPLQSFVWRGIDGSEVLAHFPPADTYTNDASVEELMRQNDKYRERAVAGVSLMLFGNGDGGGGPQAQMIERIHRYDTCPGLPRVKLASVEDFFSRLEKRRDLLPHYTGELYLELHRGTYTSQAAIKLGNFLSQVVLREVEMIYAMTMKQCDAKEGQSLVYPCNDLETMWRDTLLNQFHDVLPGSSIGLVTDDAVEIYRALLSRATTLTARRIRELLKLCLDLSTLRQSPSETDKVACLNLTCFQRKEIVPLKSEHFGDMYRKASQSDEKSLELWRGNGFSLPIAANFIESTSEGKSAEDINLAYDQCFENMRKSMLCDVLGASLDTIKEGSNEQSHLPKFCEVTVPPFGAAVASHFGIPVDLSESVPVRAGYISSDYLSKCKSGSFCTIQDVPLTKVSATGSDLLVLENAYVRYEFTPFGRIVRALDKTEVLSPPQVSPRVYRSFINGCEGEHDQQASSLWVYTDVPLFWDAWDVEIYHQQRRRQLNAFSAEVILSDPLRSAIRFQYKLFPNAQKDSPNNIVDQIVFLDSNGPRLNFEMTINWKSASHECLKVSFPFAFQSITTATYESQFGHITRSSLVNNTHDQAMFEVCGQRWATVNDGSSGVAVLTHAKHGFSARHSELSVTLLRSPTSPDDLCDRHAHRIRYALFPYSGSISKGGLARQASIYNSPLICSRIRTDEEQPSPINQASSLRRFAEKGLMFASKENVVIDVVKRAEPHLVSSVDPLIQSGAGKGGSDDRGPLVIRIHEAMGTSTYTRLYISEALGMRLFSAARCDILETAHTNLVIVSPEESGEKGYYAIDVMLNAFEFATILLEWD